MTITWLGWLLVALGGAIGASLRFWVERLLSRRTMMTHFPIALLVVNTIGSFIAGGVVVLAESGLTTLFLVVGIAGALTTYSGFARAASDRWRTSRRMFLYTVVGITVSSLTAAVLGMVCAHLLIP
jgi:CrcB protein